MKGLFSRLFGGAKSEGAADEPAPAEAVDYAGYRIRPKPTRVGAQFQTAGTIEKDGPDGVRAHRFVRAEKHASLDEARDFSLVKGRQIVDQLGDRMFDAPKGN